MVNEKIAKRIAGDLCKPERVEIVSVNDQYEGAIDFRVRKLTSFPGSQIENGNYTIKVGFLFKHDFRSIVSAFSSSGMMPDSFISMLEVDTVDEIKAA